MLSSINCKISKHLLLFALNIKWSYSTFCECHFDQNITALTLLIRFLYCKTFQHTNYKIHYRSISIEHIILVYFFLTSLDFIIFGYLRNLKYTKILMRVWWCISYDGKKTVVSIIWNGKNDILSTQKIFQCCFLLNSRSVYVTLCFTIKCSSVLIEYFFEDLQLYIATYFTL